MTSALVLLIGIAAQVASIFSQIPAYRPVRVGGLCPKTGCNLERNITKDDPRTFCQTFAKANFAIIINCCLAPKFDINSMRKYDQPIKDMCEPKPKFNTLFDKNNVYGRYIGRAFKDVQKADMKCQSDLCSAFACGQVTGDVINKKAIVSDVQNIFSRDPRIVAECKKDCIDVLHKKPLDVCMFTTMTECFQLKYFLGCTKWSKTGFDCIAMDRYADACHRNDSRFLNTKVRVYLPEHKIPNRNSFE